MSKPHWLIDDQGRPHGAWLALPFFLLFAILSTVASLALGALGYRPDAWTEAAVCLLASGLCLRLEGRPLTSLGLVPGWRWAAECLAGVLGGLLLILLMALLVRGLGGFHWVRGAGFGQLGPAAWVMLGVALHEELLFRGYPFQRVTEGAGPWAGQLGFAALFAYLHWGNPGMVGPTKAWATLNIGLAAILLGLCYLRTRSLALPIGVHLGWNWAQGSLLGFGVSGTSALQGLWRPVFHGRPDWLTGGAFGLEASVACTLVCGLAILGLWRWRGPAVILPPGR